MISSPPPVEWSQSLIALLQENTTQKPSPHKNHPQLYSWWFLKSSWKYHLRQVGCLLPNRSKDKKVFDSTTKTNLYHLKPVIWVSAPLKLDVSNVILSHSFQGLTSIATLVMALQWHLTWLDSRKTRKTLRLPNKGGINLEGPQVGVFLQCMKTNGNHFFLKDINWSQAFLGELKRTDDASWVCWFEFLIPIREALDIWYKSLSFVVDVWSNRMVQVSINSQPVTWQHELKASIPQMYPNPKSSSQFSILNVDLWKVLKSNESCNTSSDTPKRQCKSRMF